MKIIKKAIAAITAVLCLAALAPGCGRQKDDRLYDAVKAGNTVMAEECFNKGANPNGMLSGRTVIFAEACGRYRNLEMVKLFLRCGADADLYSVWNESPIVQACSYTGGEQFDIIKLLVEKGASVNTKEITVNETYFKTPLLMTAENAIYPETDYYNELFMFLIEAGADINIDTSSYGRLLHFAAQNLNYDLVKYLLENGKDPNSVNSSNYLKTPLMYAVSWKTRLEDTIGIQVEIIRLLLDNGADASAADKDGKTAFDYATELGNTAAAALLKAEEAEND